MANGRKPATSATCVACNLAMSLCEEQRAIRVEEHGMTFYFHARQDNRACADLAMTVRKEVPQPLPTAALALTGAS